METIDLSDGTEKVSLCFAEGYAEIPHGFFRIRGELLE